MHVQGARAFTLWRMSQKTTKVVFLLQRKWTPRTWSIGPSMILSAASFEFHAWVGCMDQRPFYLFFLILHAFFFLDMNLGHNFPKLFSLQIFVILDSLASITFMWFKHIWFCSKTVHQRIHILTTNKKMISQYMLLWD